jgi:group I intron endonuclease
MAILYFHKRLDDSTIFYVGIGKDEERAYNKINRSNLWKKVAKKHSYKVVIFERNLTWEQACDLEKLYIRVLGRRDLGLGNLANLTDGGDGIVGAVCSDHTKKKISEANKGKTHSDKTKRYMSETRKGEANNFYGKTHSDETKRQISETKKGTHALGGNPKAKKCMNTDTGKIYDCLKNAALDLSINYDTLRMRVRKGIGNIKYID